MQTVRVVTREEEAAGAAFVLALAAAVLALLLPSVLLPLSVSVGAGFYAHGVWGWHPLFSILLGLFMTVIFVGLAGALLALLPRIVWTAVASVYLGVMYYFAAHAPPFSGARLGRLG